MAIHAARTASLGAARDAGEHANAILNAIGDGGFLVTDDEDLAM